MRRLIEYWAVVEIRDAVGKERGQGWLNELAEAFKEKVRLIRI